MRSLRSLIFPGVKIGKFSFISAGSLVTKDTEPYSVNRGRPSSYVSHIRDLSSKKYNISYPWIINYNLGYPDEELKEIKGMLLKAGLI